MSRSVLQDARLAAPEGERLLLVRILSQRDQRRSHVVFTALCTRIDGTSTHIGKSAEWRQDRRDCTPRVYSDRLNAGALHVQLPP